MIYLKKLQVENQGIVVDTYTVIPFANDAIACYMQSYPFKYSTQDWNSCSYVVYAPCSLGGISSNKLTICNSSTDQLEYVKLYDQDISVDAKYQFDYQTNFSHNIGVVDDTLIVAHSFYGLRENSGKIEALYKSNGIWKTAKFVDVFNDKSTFDNIGQDNQNLGQYLIFLNRYSDIPLKGQSYYDDGTSPTLNPITFCDMPPYSETYDENNVVGMVKSKLYEYLSYVYKQKYNHTISDTILLASTNLVGGELTVKAYEVISDDLNINNYSGSEYVKIVETDKNCKILYNIDRNETQPFTVYDCSNGITLNPIYTSAEFKKENMYDNCHIYPTIQAPRNYLSPIGKIDKILSVGSSSFGFMKDIKQPFLYFDELKQEYLQSMPTVSLYNKDMNMCNLNGTLIYCNLVCQSLSKIGVSEDQYIINDRVKIKGLAYSIGMNLPLTLDYYNYNLGSLWNDGYTFNNELDFKYDTNISECQSSQFFIHYDNVREYVKIGLNNKTVWATYNSNVKYISIECCSTSYQNILDWETEVPIVNMQYDSKCTNVGELYDLYQYEQLERIYDINRPFTDVSHKSNIYSVELVNTGLNENLSDTNIKLQIQKSIEKVIKDYLKEVAPAHTNLWKIIWRGL